MKLSQLKYFCTVVEQKTIAAAARELHCVPSNVTLRLRELEESLGGELFFRDKNRLYVNPKGRLFYQQARDIVAQAERSKQLFAGEHQHGLLNLGALDFSLVSHLPARIAGGDGIEMVHELQQLLSLHAPSAQVLAASFKTPRQALECLLAGCQAITLPVDVAEQFLSAPAVQAAVEKFEQDWQGAFGSTLLG